MARGLLEKSDLLRRQVDCTIYEAYAKCIFSHDLTYLYQTVFKALIDCILHKGEILNKYTYLVFESVTPGA